MVATYRLTYALQGQKALYLLLNFMIIYTNVKMSALNVNT